MVTAFHPTHGNRKCLDYIHLGSTTALWYIISNNYRDLIVNSDKTLMTWLNAFEYHRDNDKRKLIEEIDKIIPEDFSRALFASMIIDKVRAVLELGDVITFLESWNGSMIKRHLTTS